MTEKQERLVRKFLDTHFSNLDLSETRKKTHQTLSRNKGKTHIFLIEKELKEVYVNSKIVIDPILNMFNTDYTETYDFVKNWLLEKYNIESEEIIGAKMII